MSLFVLDTSVAVKCEIPEPDSQQALAFQDDIRNLIHEIIAPDVFAEEVGGRERREFFVPAELDSVGTHD